MRVWDKIDPKFLCRQHLLGEHKEIHGIYTVISEGREGYSHHTETKRWVGRLPALKKRHDMISAEMLTRGYNHQSPLSEFPGSEEFPDPIDDQFGSLARKKCGCKILELFLTTPSESDILNT